MRKKHQWTKEQTDLIFKSRENQETFLSIGKRFGVPESAIRRHYNREKESRKNTREQELLAARLPDLKTIELYISSGLNPSDASLIHRVKTDQIRPLFEEAGWIPRPPLSPNLRISKRRKIEKIATELVGCELDRKNPEHLMVLLSLAGEETKRDLVEVSKLTILPLTWINRVFGLIDAVGIWPAGKESHPNMTASDYHYFAEICEMEMDHIKDILE